MKRLIPIVHSPEEKERWEKASKEFNEGLHEELLKKLKAKEENGKLQQKRKRKTV